MEAVSLSIGEVVKLAAVDSEVYCRTFFPKAFRQKSPEFHKEIWADLEDPNVRYPNIRAFRGSAKTTICRAFSSKRIAYGISKTILYVGASEAHAQRSIRWLRRQVEINKLWAGTFGLSRGEKWDETQIQILQRVPTGNSNSDGSPEFEESTIWVLGVGITGNIRGINFDDYRPDLIILDDIITDENAATDEQRTKISDLLFGALMQSLAPVSEEPNAKMALLSTPQHEKDAANLAQTDIQFKTLSFPCWTKETMDSPVRAQESSWPERYSSEELRAAKLASMARNKLSTFTKEMEVRLITAEEKAFRPWLIIQSDIPLHPYCVSAIDPVPPPSDRQIAKGMKGKDFEAHVVWGREGGEYFLLDYAQNRGHDPNWSVNQFFTFAQQYRISSCVVETIAYQRTLKWIIEQEMQRRRQYFVIFPYSDTRKKTLRIITTLSGIAAQGKLHIRPHHTEFAQQFADYSEITDGVDDLLDASAMALSKLVNPALERGHGNYLDSDVEELEFTRSCP